MPGKMFKLMLVWLILLTTTAFAQRGVGYSVFDSAVISARKMPQQNEFWNNNYNYPAKPRSMWEVGASIGSIAIAGDIPSKIPALGYEAHIRKALGYVFSLRLQYAAGTAKGINWKASNNYQKNPAWLSSAVNSNSEVTGNLPAGVSYNPSIRDANGQLKPLNAGAVVPIFQNYRSNVQDLSLQALVSFNNIGFHKRSSKIAVYGGVGVGFTAFYTMVNALNDQNGGGTYATLFQGLYAQSGIYNNKKAVLKALKSGMDNTYETAAEEEGDSQKKYTLKPTGNVVGGIAYKISNRINIALEDRHTFIKSDLLDGSRWQESPVGDAVQTRAFDSWNLLTIGVNYNIGGKSVEPLWWLNPLDYAYGELNNPKHMKLPTSVFDDADGDGVTDQLDREPDTPAGCPVDAHGVTKDTDGDGVPDCKDKQLITPSECQPVDANGVGKCPDGPCCQEIKDSLAKIVDPKSVCPADYPTLVMKNNNLNKDAKAMCTTIAAKLKEFPACTIAITAHTGPSKAMQSSSEKRLNIIKNYLVETLGVSAGRIIVDKVIGGGDLNTFDIKSN